MKFKRGLLCLFLGILGIFSAVSYSFGAEFAFSEGSARGSSLAGTLVGRADDPSALFYNPAGITQLPGLQLMTGAAEVFNGKSDKKTIFVSDGNKVSAVKVGPDDASWVPPHFYSTYQFNDRVWLGLGAFSQYGLDRISSLRTMTINPNVAFKINENLSIGLGMDIETFALSEDKSAVLGIDDSDCWSYGFNLAAHYKLSEQWRIGAAYRNLIDSNFDKGDKGASSSAHTLLVVDVPSGPSTHVLSFAIAWFPQSYLSLEAGAVWTGEVRDSKTNEAWRLQFGAEYKAADWLDLRAGYAYDEDPAPKGFVFLDSESFGDPHHIFSFGPGFHWRNWTLDLAYSYIHNPSTGGAWKADDDGAQAMSLSIGCKL